jgi:hypothetical protein
MKTINVEVTPRRSMFDGVSLPKGTAPLYIYQVSHGHDSRYYRYKSFIVVAATEDDARSIHPSGDNDQWGDYDWVQPSNACKLQVKRVGTANDGMSAGTVLLAA